MSLGRRVVDYLVPIGIAGTALLNARTVSSLVGATLTPSVLFVPSIAEASTAPMLERPTADGILKRNPFDHTTKLVVVDSPPGERASDDPFAAPICVGVKSLVVAGAADPDVSLAAFDVAGTRVLRRRGGEVAGMRVAFVGRDRVWLEKDGALCQSRIFDPVAMPVAAPAPAPKSLEGDLVGKIVRVSPTEFQVDRGAVDCLLDAQAELMKLRLVPEKEGVRLLGIKPGSAVSMLGLENGDRLETVNGIEVSNSGGIFEAYAKLKSGTIDRLTLRVSRQGKGMNIDYVVR